MEWLAEWDVDWSILGYAALIAGAVIVAAIIEQHTEDCRGTELPEPGADPEGNLFGAAVRRSEDEVSHREEQGESAR